MRNVTISGLQFEVRTPYAEGHTLSATEANVLNQTFLENVRNNLASKVKAAKEAAEKAGTEFSADTPIEGDEEGRTLRQVIQAYADAYEFGERQARTSEPADPVEREARALAREAINAQLKKQGVKRKDVDDEAYEQAVATHAQNARIREEAERRVAAKQALAIDELDLPAAQAEADEGDESESEGEPQESAPRGRRARQSEPAE